MFVKNRRAFVLPAVALASLAGLALTENVRADDHKTPSHSESGAAKHESKPSPFKSKPRTKSRAKDAESEKAEAKPDAKADDAKSAGEHAEHGAAAVSEATTDSHGAATHENAEHAVEVTSQTGKSSSATKSSVDDPANSDSLPEAGAISADTALTLLKEGNARWVADQETNPGTSVQRRASNASDGQRPFATVLTCADSRVPVERVFDRGVGEVFTIRVAGNVAGTNETGTIEYGVGHLKTHLLVVMGHTKCGAVGAACSSANLHGAVGELVASIKPAVERAQRQNEGADEAQLAAASVRENVWQSVYQLLKSDDIRSLVDTGEVKIVGAVYDIASGKVEWLGEHPWQQELIVGLKAGSQQTQNAVAHADGAGESNAAASEHHSEHASANEDHK